MRNKIISQATWIMILVVIVSKRGTAIVDIKPTDTVVLLKGSTFFNCSTFNFTSSSEEIAWYHYSVSSNQRRDVYEDGEIRTNYESRFRVEKDLSKGVVNLIVQAPTLEDAGTYECQDGKGIGETARAQLIVLEAEPVCQSNIQPDGVLGSNDCRIPPDQVEMSCGVAYRGNNPVHLEWRNGLEDDNSPLTVECSSTTNRSTCNLTVTGDRAKDNSVYICQTKNTGTKEFGCSSDVIRILYVMSDNTTTSKTDLDEYRCSVNSSQQCSYTWSSDDGTIISTSQSLKPTRSGQYLCKAKCNIRGQTCVVIARNLNVSIETTTGETSKAGLIAGVIVALFVIAGIITWFQYKKWKKKNQPRIFLDDKEEKASLQDTMNENGNNHTARAESQVSVDSPDVIVSEVPAVEHGIQKLFNEAPLIDKGLSGEIYGPVQYKGIQCVRERIVCFGEQQTLVKKGRRWMALNHDNLIKFYEIVQQPPVVYIVMEFAAGGSVRKALNTYTEDLSTSMVLDWAKQVANGMEYLHEKNIIHKGLKCAQILIKEPFDSSTSAQMTLKIASYSLAYEININPSKPVTFKGMFEWMAPEAFAESEQSQLSHYSDIWSFGVTVWEILTRGIPYKGYNGGSIINGISSGTLSLQIPDSCPQVLHDIIKECFDLEPKRRPAFSEILARLR